MEERWINASRALEVLSKTAKQTLKLTDLKRICVAGGCTAYISCGEATGTELDTQAEVRALGRQSVINPVKLKATNLKYVNHTTIEILTISDEIVVKGRIGLQSLEHASIYQESATWRLTDKSIQYPASFKLSEIEALSKQTILTLTRTKPTDRADKNPRPCVDSISPNLDTVKELEQQLEAERSARIEAEKKLESMTGSLKNSHLLTVAGLLDLLLMEHNKPRYDQSKIAYEIDAKGWRGASVSTITKLFAEAKAAAKEAEKVTQAKLEAREQSVNPRARR